MYVSVMRKWTHLSKEVSSLPYYALEASVLNVENPITGVNSSMYAVARIVPNIDKYA